MKLSLHYQPGASPARLIVTTFALAAIALSAGCGGLAGRMIVAPQNGNDAGGFDGIQEEVWATATGSEFLRLGEGGAIAASSFPPGSYDFEWRVAPQRDADGSRSGTFVFSRTQRADDQAGEASRGTVLLMHGFSMNRRGMAIYAMMFADAGFSALAIDLPGHGDSQADVISYGVFEAPIIASLQQQLEALGYPRPYILMGVSYGGSLALRTAALSGGWDYVIAMQPFDDPRAVIPNFRVLMPRPWRWFAGDGTVRRGLENAEQRGGFRWQQATIAPLLADYATPTFLLHSRQDMLIPASQSELLQAQAPGAIELLIVEDGGDHMAFPLHVWKRCADILSWLDARVASSRPASRGDTCTRMAPPEPVMATD